MAVPHPPAPSDPKAARRGKVIIVSGAAVLAIAIYALSTFTGHVAQLHERKVLAGDYAHIHLDQAEVRVTEKGEVQPAGRFVQVNPRYVASLRLVPPGDYQAVLVAHDAEPGARKKAEIVIGARDARGGWHPPSAEQILDRLEVPKPGEPQ